MNGSSRYRCCSLASPARASAWAGSSAISTSSQNRFFSNYAAAWTDDQIGQAFANSLIVSVGGGVLVVALTSTMGYALGRYSFPGKKIPIGLLAALVVLRAHDQPDLRPDQQAPPGGKFLRIILAEAGSTHIIRVLLYSGYFSRLPKALEGSR